MPNNPLRSGVTFRIVGVPDEEVEKERRALERLGAIVEARLVVEEFTLAKLEAIYDSINGKYGTNLQASRDFQVLSTAKNIAAGEYCRDQEPSELKSVVAELERYLQNLDGIVAFSAAASEGWIEDAARSHAARLVAVAMTDLGIEANVTNANARIGLLQVSLEPQQVAAKAVLASLRGLKIPRGRPTAKWRVAYYGAIESVLARAGVPAPFHYPPNPENPGILLDLAVRLEAFLPSAMRSWSLEAAAKRIKTCRDRRRRARPIA
jgi:hypothetical protein